MKKNSRRFYSKINKQEVAIKTLFAVKLADEKDIKSNINNDSNDYDKDDDDEGEEDKRRVVVVVRMMVVKLLTLS